jgi:Cu(I)/Ag(I) efflux system membrane fusion protein/cobalt-zinc-cadmium efflux system membrane fusion protein
VTADETQTAQISLKTSGWIEKLFVDFTGMYVEKGQPMFEIFSPDLLAAQEELLAALSNPRDGFKTSGRDLLESARRRIRNFDVAESEIRKIEKSGKVNKTLIIRSPLAGYVIEKKVEEGSYVKAGVSIFRVADLTRVWVEAHIYEFELPLVREGQQAEMTLSYLPGRRFSGKVTYVYPYLQPKTRDVVIRLEFDNPDLLLKPDMYANISIRITADEKGLVIPSEAVIRSGERNLVFVEREENKFTPRDVTLGITVDGGRVHVLTGLAPGETVVTSGQFLLDSESKLKEAVQKMMEARRGKAKTEVPVEEMGERKEPSMDAGTEEDFFKDMEKDEDFSRDIEKDEDFFKDLEAESKSG